MHGLVRSDISLATPGTVHRAQPHNTPKSTARVFHCRSVLSVQSSTHAKITEQPLDLLVLFPSESGWIGQESTLVSV